MLLSPALSAQPTVNLSDELNPRGNFYGFIKTKRADDAARFAR
jgi:hypothetical protein